MTQQRSQPMKWTLAVLSLFLSSCLDTTTTTTVHRDGTLTRTMTFTGDSAIIERRQFPLRVDSTWSVTSGKTDQNKMFVTVERTFASTSELNAALRGEDLKHVTIETDLESTFRWFFTTYRYRETWKSFKQIKEVPLSRYVDTTLIDVFFRHEILKEPFTSAADSVALEQAEEPYEQYRIRNIFEAYYKEFVKGVGMLGDQALTIAGIEPSKEELFRQTTEAIEKGNIDTVQILFAKTLKNRTVFRAIEANNAGFEKMKERIDFENTISGYGYKVTAVMPGIITSTNSRSLEGNSVSWDDFIVMGLFADIDLWVESRAMNWWAVILTGIVVAGILTYLFAAMIRARKV